MKDFYDVYYDGKVCGGLKICPAGATTAFSCDCEIVSGDILRLFIKSGGDYKALGVCAPEGGRLRLYRLISPRGLSDMGIADIDGCLLSPSPPETAESSSGWKPAGDLSELLKDEGVLSIPGALIKARGDLTLLAAPLGEEEFPLMPVFRFGTPETIAGEQYLVFGIKNGRIVT